MRFINSFCQFEEVLAAVYCRDEEVLELLIRAHIFVSRGAFFLGEGCFQGKGEDHLPFDFMGVECYRHGSITRPVGITSEK